MHYRHTKPGVQTCPWQEFRLAEATIEKSHAVVVVVILNEIELFRVDAGLLAGETSKT